MAATTASATSEGPLTGSRRTRFRGRPPHGRLALAQGRRLGDQARQQQRHPSPFSRRLQYLVHGTGPPGRVFQQFCELSHLGGAEALSHSPSIAHPGNGCLRGHRRRAPTRDSTSSPKPPDYQAASASTASWRVRVRSLG